MSLPILTKFKAFKFWFRDCVNKQKLIKNVLPDRNLHTSLTQRNIPSHWNIWTTWHTSCNWHPARKNRIKKCLNEHEQCSIRVLTLWLVNLIPAVSLSYLVIRLPATDSHPEEILWLLSFTYHLYCKIILNKTTIRICVK